MSQYRKSNLPGIADSTLAGAGPYARVKVTGGSLNSDLSITVGIAGVSDLAIGNIDAQQANATGDQVNIWLRNDNKTRQMVAAGAIAFATYVYAAASGQVAQTGTVLEGLALAPATAEGDVIEVLPLTGPLNVAGINKAPTVLSGSADAISPHVSATYVITTAGVDSTTLAAPTAGTDDGVEIIVISGGAHAHTITATGLLNTGSASVNVATFAAHAGASVTLVAYQGAWYTKAQIAITFS